MVTRVALCTVNLDAVVSVENQMLTTDTAVSYHHAQQLSQLTTAAIMENRRVIFLREEMNIKTHTPKSQTNPSCTPTKPPNTMVSLPSSRLLCYPSAELEEVKV